ncbi:MAG TPA: phosphoribosylglycinamide formyltransferase [Gammaproteobacteria bacterium]|nr:phosphoribosylglycinamide formyltransferase [Gammaproteobacteria bacterium]
MTRQEKTPLLPIVVLVSGSGTNLQVVLDQAASGELPVDVRAVISNRPGVKALERAQAAGVTAQVLDHKQFTSRADYDAALMNLIDNYQPALVVLAGFMRILSADFVRHYAGRLLNIHPSLLPKYRGLHTHRSALANGDTVHGVSVHFVTEELDSGPTVLQAEVPVLPGDTEDTLTARVQSREYVIYPQVIRWIAEGRLKYQQGKPMFDGECLEKPHRLAWNDTL